MKYITDCDGIHGDLKCFTWVVDNITESEDNWSNEWFGTRLTIQL